MGHDHHVKDSVAGVDAGIDAPRVCTVPNYHAISITLGLGLKPPHWIKIFCD